jgi:hypothetical protein
MKKKRRTNKRKTDVQTKERKTDGQTKKRKTKRDRQEERQRDRQTNKRKKERQRETDKERDRQLTDIQKERLNFSVFPGIREHIFGNELSVPIFGNKKLKLPDSFSKTGTRKLWCLT